MKNGVLPGLFLACLMFNTAVADELTDEAQRLISANRPKEAYGLLIAQLEQRAGTPEYDLLLGIAALESGLPTQAVFALERVLEVDPENQRARLELARAYYEAGENEASRDEFVNVRNRQVPEDVARTIETYLTEIDSRLSGSGRRHSFYLQATAGYDSNVNSATDSSTVAVPAFGNLVFTLDDTARELDSGFYQIEGGAGFSSMLPGRENMNVFGNIKAFYRPAWNQHNFDTGAADAQLGLRFAAGSNAYTASLIGQSYLIDEDINRHQAGMNLQWLRMAGDDTQYSLFGQGVIQRYPDQDVRDVNQYTLGAGMVHLAGGSGEPVIYAGMYAGMDDERDSTRPDIGRKFGGARIGGQYTLREDLNLVGGVNYQYSRYGGEDALFLERRKDHFGLLYLGLEYTLRDNWVVRPEMQYLRNKSNLAINDFNRWQAFISARYNF
jgi:tetratricopeptide (TPR) repeat protein